MTLKTILMLSLSFITFDLQSPQLKLPGQSRDNALPQELTETESNKILKENSPGLRVEATLKVSDVRLASASKSAEVSEFKSAAQDVDIYADLIIYADSYTRGLTGSQSKDRNLCLKKIEQTIFKQTRSIDSVMRLFPVDYRDAEADKIDKVKKIRLRAVDDLLGGGKVINPSE